MSSFKEFCLPAVVKSAARVFRFLPLRVSLWVGRCAGRAGYCLLPKKRAVVYANLKTAFAAQKSPAQLRALTKDVFVNFAQNFVELLCLPKIKRRGFERFVELRGTEHIDEALGRNKGLIFLAIHSGNWELASVVGGMRGYPYNVVANEQPKMPQLDVLLNECRRIAGARVIASGVATKEIIRVLQNNEIVSLVLDQGGKEGVAVKFFGKTAAMSTGAIRLALKYGCALCPVWIKRKPNGRHILEFFSAMALTSTGDLEKDIAANVRQAASRFEGLLHQHPAEYMWFYKIFKYTTQAHIVILDDGRTGHLRQSQALARALAAVLKKRGKQVQETTCALDFRNTLAAKWFSFYAFLAQRLGFLRNEDCLQYALTRSCYQSLMSLKADFVISCGSQAAAANFILSQNHLAKSIAVLTPGLLSLNNFHLVVLPEHDRPRAMPKTRLVTTKVAPNLVNAAYLKTQGDQLLNRYAHLKGNVRTKFGVLLGGNTKGVAFHEAKIRLLLNQMKEAALHYNADILLTTSRRTPPAIDQMIAKELKNFERCPLCIMANSQNVPEAVGGILELSDLVVVSGESISMVSEALSSGKRTIAFAPQGQYGPVPRDKYERFVLKLNDEGYLIASAVKDLSAKIAQLLSCKITLKALDDERRIMTALEGIV